MNKLKNKIIKKSVKYYKDNVLKNTACAAVLGESKLPKLLSNKQKVNNK